MKKRSFWATWILSLAVLFSSHGIAVADTYSTDIVPLMTASNAPAPYKISASSEYPSGGHPAYKAFDNDVSVSGWLSNDTVIAWLKVELPEGKKVGKYTLSSRQGTPTAMPKNWTFEGSTDDVNWSVLDTRSNQIGWKYPEKRAFTFANDTAYRYYRINISAVEYSSMIVIGDMELMESLTPPPSQTVPQMDITSATEVVHAGSEFTTDVVISNASNLYAEDITIAYDTDLFTLVKTESPSSGLQIYEQIPSGAGQVRVIVASKGEAYVVNGNKSLLTLTFRAKNGVGTGRIEVNRGIVADGNGTEMTSTVSGKAISVMMYDEDINGDGRYSLTDLAITAFHYGKAPTNWVNQKVDVNKDHVVADADLSLIVEKILAQP